MREHGQAPEHSFSGYNEAVNWITGLVSFGIKPGLKRMEKLMELLDHPERHLRFIHVAGTNGKGSTCAFLTSALVRNGYDVGTFTSPYIERYTNRIRFNEKDIPDEDLIRLANRLKPLVDQIALTDLGSPTMFEVSTALALMYFAGVSKPDFVVWETGLGGRLDSTNIVTPVISIITNVGHDHQDILGDTLEQVAEEKAGIIKPGVPVVSACEQPGVIRVMEQACREKTSDFYLLGREFEFQTISTELNRQRFKFSCPFRTYGEIAISLNGFHQIKNASAALMALEVLQRNGALTLKAEDLLAGLYAAQWPGRLEMVSEQPRVLLDGAHNPEGAETLAAALKSAYRYRKLHLMMGMLSTKNHSGYLKHILPIVDTLIVTEPDFHKKLAAEKLAELADGLVREMGVCPKVIVEPDWKTALAKLTEMTGQEDLAVVSGTLYLISDVRTWLLFHSDSEKGW